jgi:signal transduction histidine kinase
MQAFIDFLAIKGLIPHGYCLNWNPLLLGLHVASDVLIALAYYSIPLSLAYFVWLRKDSPYPKLFFTFGLFILACGTTHFLSAVMIWIPLYWLDGYVKAFTAMVSVTAAVLIFRVIPRALQLPNAAQLQAEIEQRKLAELQLRENEQHLTLSQEYGGIGSWEHDLITNLQIWSLTTFQLAGLPYKTHPTWDDFLAIIYPEDRQRLLEAHQAHLNQGDKYDVEYRIFSTHGQHRWMRSIGRAEFAADGTPTRFIGIVQDITERKLMEAELKRSNADLEQFAYAISHDMRQPLRMVTSYLGLIENALGQQLDEEQQQFLNFAIDGAKRMDAMILSLLEYSRVGHKTAAIIPVDSRAALNEALAFLEPECLASGGNIVVYGDWSEVMIDSDELTRLLQNLIGNALKYHQENLPPCVEVCALTTANSFKVCVRDNGIGIDNKDIERLFKVFSRLQARSRFEGTGVGLALCRKIVENYGGNIGVESAGEELGSVFWFELPRSQSVSIELKP